MMPHASRPAACFLALSCSAAAGNAAAAAPPADVDPLEEVVITAPVGTPLELTRVPTRVETATAADIERLQPLDLTDFLNRGFGSVNINHAQNNPLQPDVNFRGFTASPLLGLSPGITVYQNGVRINEPFGDTVNWDLIPLSAIESVQMLAGANPVFGLNSLGGTLALRMKSGFSFEGTAADVYAGSFERRGASLQHGGNDGTWGWYANIDYFEEDGWRDFSDSDALRFFGAVSLRGEGGTLDLSLAHADTELRGNGTAPVELLAIDRAQVFTHPDLTENRLTQLILEGAREVSGALRIGGNVYYRDLDTETFNGDGTIFEECELGEEEFLVREDFEDLNDDDECSLEDDAGIVLVRDPSGEPIEAELGGAELDAVNNLGRRVQESYGASVQLDRDAPLGGLDNVFTLGAAWGRGDSSFDSVVEVARLLESRATSRTGIFADEFRTAVGSDVETASVYFADTLSLTGRTALSFSGRYDNTRIRLADRSGQTPELDGSHEFERFNPAVGLTFQATPALTLYGSYGQSARAPTPVELACADENAPCNLPNAFLADPPLEQVVAHNAELGARGTAGTLRWYASAFRTRNDDDILFQTIGGPQANVGFFDNVGDTLRQGVELGLTGRGERLRWSAEYSYIEATFDDAFIVNSPNHPLADGDSPLLVGEDKFLVPSGSSIPGIPEHQANLAVDYAVNDRFSLGADVVVRSGVYLRGDEINALGRTDGYGLLNLHGEYRLSEQAVLFARVENALDEEYETFGLLGEPDEVFPDFEDPRFYGAGPPFGAWLGFRIALAPQNR